MALNIAATVSADEKHEYDVTSLVFTHGKLYSASDDGKIKVWSTDLRLEKQIQAHPCSAYSLATNGTDTIYSCSNDGTVRAWGLENLEEKEVIMTSDREFWKLYWDDGVLYIVNDDGTICLYKDGKKTGEIQTMEQIKDMAVVNHLVFAVRDLDVFIAEIMNEKGRTITCRMISGRAPLCLIGDKLCFSSRDGREILINFNNKENKFREITKIKEAHDKLINDIVGFEKDDHIILYSTAWDNLVKQWIIDPEKPYCKSGPKCDVGACVNVLCLGSNESEIFAAGADGKIWRLEYTES